MKKSQNYKSKVKTLLLLTFALNFYLFSFIFCLSHAESEKTSIARVEKLFLAGRYEKVISEVDTLIDSRAQQRDELYYLKGLSQLKSNRFKDARENFEKVISLFPKSKRVIDAYIGIGDSYFLEGDTNAATRTYQDIIDRYPNDKNISVVYYKIGNCFKNIGSNDKANEYFDKAKVLSPLSFEAKMTPSAVLRKIPQGEQDDYFSVQVGCFKNKKNAEKLTSKLSGQDFDSFMELPVSSNDKLYRVKVGRFKSKGEAKALASKLKRFGHSTKICTKNVCE